MKIEIKHRYSGDVLFEHEQENNSIKVTVCAAIKSGADLSVAYLSGADLYGADLSGADLSRSDLSEANLSEAKNIYDSHEILAEIAIRFDVTLKPVAAMIRGRIVGCWKEYTKTIRNVFGDETINRLSNAWLQDESWGVRKRLITYGWIKENE